MKRAVVLLWLLFALSVLLAGGLWLAGWLPLGGAPSIVLDERPAPSQMVENGSAYDRAAFDLGAAKKVVLSDWAMVRRSAETEKVVLFMKKTLNFSGHPSERVSIRDERKRMGCVVKAKEGALVIATFGEWDSHIEGGAYMRVIAVIPEGVEVEQRNGLSGEHSAGKEWPGGRPPWPGEPKGGYVWGPGSVAGGWKAIPDVPDSDHTAEGYGPPKGTMHDHSGK
ncbi:MAG TPA: hypothetical protein VGJ05_03875 [Fimbriiglobus sp.]|jgi:hypothetical protein